MALAHYIKTAPTVEILVNLATLSSGLSSNGLAWAINCLDINAKSYKSKLFFKSGKVIIFLACSQVEPYPKRTETVLIVSLRRS